MRTDRFVPKPLSNRPALPFTSAEAAWMWFWQCQTQREIGARFVADAGDTARPCDPDDIYRVAARLFAQRALTRPQVEVLARFGRRLSPPDGRLREEAADARIWGEGLDRLETALAAKGIVRPPAPEHPPGMRGLR